VATGALRIRHHVLLSFKKAETEPDSIKQTILTTLVAIGG